MELYIWNMLIFAVDMFHMVWKLKAGFQHVDFSASAEFFACADFSASPLSNFNHNAGCFKIQILNDLDIIKIANKSNIKFSIVACKKSVT